MAVDVKQLRVGSHINLCGDRQHIAAIDALNGLIGIDAYKTDENGVKHSLSYKAEDIEPISITPALLKELGFKCTDKGRIQSWWRDFFCLDYLGGKGYYNFGAIHLKYLHELESLFYMLYGVELIKE